MARPRPGELTGERVMDEVRCLLLLYLAERDSVDRKIFPNRSLLVYLTGSNSD